MTMTWQLKGLDKERFYAVLHKRQTLRRPVCFSAHQSPSEKGSSIKGKDLLPTVANSFFLLLSRRESKQL